MKTYTRTGLVDQTRSHWRGMDSATNPATRHGDESGHRKYHGYREVNHTQGITRLPSSASNGVTKAGQIECGGIEAPEIY